MARLTEQELMDFAEAQLPPVGTQVSYADFHAQIKASAQPDAIRYYRLLKKSGKVKATLTQNPDGTISHMIERAGA